MNSRKFDWRYSWPSIIFTILTTCENEDLKFKILQSFSEELLLMWDNIIDIEIEYWQFVDRTRDREEFLEKILLTPGNFRKMLNKYH